MGESSVASIVCHEKFSSPGLSLRAITVSIEGNAKDFSIGRIFMLEENCRTWAK